MTNLVLDGVDGDDEQQLAALMDNGDLRPSDDDDDDDADNEAEAALDSILETSVAEVNLALSHDDAVTAAVNAAALDATTNADVTSVIDEVAVTAAAAAADAVSMQPIDGHETEPTTEAETLPMNTSVEGINSGTIDMLTPEERQEYLVKNLNMNIVAAAGSSNNNGDPPRVGRWTLDEKILFLYGLQEFGKGHWKKISAYVPGRSLVQIKSHAQKVLKRIHSGENVFLRLEENISRLYTLVNQIHETLGLDPPTAVLQPSTFSQNINDNIRKNKLEVNNKTTTSDVADDGAANDTKPRKRARTKGKSSKEGTEHLAASALCQLAGPESDEDGADNEAATADVEGNDAKPNDVAEIGIDDETSKSLDDVDIGITVGI